MEKRVAILQEWFDRVDSEKSGSITAVQLKVGLNELLVLMICGESNINLLFSLISYQTALAVGNLEFPLSVVQQMIRWPSPIHFLLLFLFLYFNFQFLFLFPIGCTISTGMVLWAFKVSLTYYSNSNFFSYHSLCFQPSNNFFLSEFVSLNNFLLKVCL